MQRVVYPTVFWLGTLFWILRLPSRFDWRSRKSVLIRAPVFYSRPHRRRALSIREMDHATQLNSLSNRPPHAVRTLSPHYFTHRQQYADETLNSRDENELWHSQGPQYANEGHWFEPAHFYCYGGVENRTNLSGETRQSRWVMHASITLVVQFGGLFIIPGAKEETNQEETLWETFNLTRFGRGWSSP